MEYTPELAEPFIGKRILVSIRNIHSDGQETLDGFHGVIESAHDNGLVLRVEGRGEDQYWVMPPDLEALVPARAEAYQLVGSDTVVRDIDYVASFASADSPADLPYDDEQA